MHPEEVATNGLHPIILKLLKIWKKQKADKMGKITRDKDKEKEKKEERHKKRRNKWSRVDARRRDHKMAARVT